MPQIFSDKGQTVPFCKDSGVYTYKPDALREKNLYHLFMIYWFSSRQDMLTVVISILYGCGLNCDSF